MEQLHERLAQLTAKWRANGYPCEEAPAIGEILEWAGEAESGDLRFLRRPQLNALETYWYLRLVEQTPHVFALYSKLFGDRRRDLREALGVPAAAFEEVDYDLDELARRIAEDDNLVKRFRLEALRETLGLAYPSYILALAMGAGKTILIGAIIATEFAMAQEYADGAFVRNALVFAPGKTIIESLRELTEVPYERILPARMYKGFAASLKLTFTRDGETDIPVIRGSAWNVVITNTEKIRIQKETIRRSEIGRLFDTGRLDEARAEVANRRLQAIASLPSLAIFSDEAHHTYGQSLERDLKKVRKTVDYLSDQTSLVCVINTTGTPYFKRQPLRDVVVWYGLSQGIADGILKDVAGNIQSYDFAADPAPYVAHVVRDFFAEYGDHALPNGALAKLAMYFPQTDDLKALRPVIDAALVEVGQSPSVALVNTSDQSMTKPADIEAFNRLNDPRSPHRVVLLVNKGTEGWNCPSLFACALVRKLTSSNNFVLQASSRCLRQVPGNTKPARIYLSTDNYSILDRQLAETYGESIAELNGRLTERRTARLVLRKLDIPPLQVTQVLRTVVRHEEDIPDLDLSRPAAGRKAGLTRRTYTMAEQHVGRRVLRQLEDALAIETQAKEADAYRVATELAAQYRLDLWTVYDQLRRIYGAEGIPLQDLSALAYQIEEQTRTYEVHEEFVDQALALVKPEGFEEEADGDGQVFTAQILYPKDREHYLVKLSDFEGQNPGEFGFHYEPYNFDSNPEKHFFQEVLAMVNLQPEEVEDVYFTGGITDPGKTDFFVEYLDRNKKWRRYIPDFVIRKKSGQTVIVEIKSERDRGDAVNGEEGAKAIALRKWETLNPDRIQYEMIFTKTDAIPADLLSSTRAFIGATPTGSNLHIHVDRSKIEEFCRKWGIIEFSFFGSVLRDDFGPDSDVDVLVRFGNDRRWGLFDLSAMEEELASILGRKVDLGTFKSIEQSPNWIRRTSILESAEAYLVPR